MAGHDGDRCARRVDRDNPTRFVGRRPDIARDVHEHDVNGVTRPGFQCDTYCVSADQKIVRAGWAHHRTSCLIDGTKRTEWRVGKPRIGVAVDQAL